MASAPVTLAPADPVWRWRCLALVLILGTAALRVFQLTQNFPLDLAPDEAHYWDWSRHLDWSYYSKGPLVAYLIRLACLLAGWWSQNLVGSEMVAVRLPAVVCGGLLLTALYVLTTQVYRREALAFLLVAIAVTTPVLAAGATLMTIDAPYTCCWAWALVFGHRAVFGGRPWAWPITGLLVGLGILAKYTMVLWVPSLGLFLLLCPAQRRLLFRPGFWVMAGLGALCCVPILVWNAQHDWVSLRHVESQANGDQTLRPLGPLVFVATQFAVLLGFWFVVWVRALWTHAPWRESDDGVRYLWWMSVPMFAVFLAFSLKNGGGEPNWPVTAYISGAVLSAGWLARDLQRAGPTYRRWCSVGVCLTVGLGLMLTTVLYRQDLVQPLLVKLAGPATPERPQPMRKVDPTCRLRGWRTLAAEVDRDIVRLRGEGVEPIVVASFWNIPGELAFYCQGHPVVYTVGLALDDRCSQYDLWHPNPLADPEPFLGKTFIYIGNTTNIRSVFDSLDETREVIYREGEHAISSWMVTVCRGYHGFPKERLKGGGDY